MVFTTKFVTKEVIPHQDLSIFIVSLLITSKQICICTFCIHKIVANSKKTVKAFKKVPIRDNLNNDAGLHLGSWNFNCNL